MALTPLTNGMSGTDCRTNINACFTQVDTNVTAIAAKVASVTGTANQITVTGTTTPTLSLPATITGLTSVTSTTFVGALTGTASGNLTSGGAIGTPASGTLTNCTGLTAAGVTGTALTLAGGTLTGALTLPNAIFSGLSLTSAQATNTIDVSATWNTSGNPSLIYGRVTNTASGSSANLLDIGTVAGGSLFKVDKAGKITINAGQDALAFATVYSKITTAPGLIFTASAGSQDRAMISTAVNKGFSVVSSGCFGWDANASNISDVLDTILARDAAGILAQRNSTNAQTSRIYGTYTDASNYVRASLAASSTLVTLAAQTAGTGADNIDIDITTAGTGLVNLATQTASADAAVVSTHTARIKIGGVEYKVLLATP